MVFNLAFFVYFLLAKLNLKNLHKLEPKNELPHLPDACKFYAKGILSLLKQFIVRILTIIG